MSVLDALDPSIIETHFVIWLKYFNGAIFAKNGLWLPFWQMLPF